MRIVNDIDISLREMILHKLASIIISISEIMIETDKIDMSRVRKARLNHFINLADNEIMQIFDYIVRSDSGFKRKN